MADAASPGGPFLAPSDEALRASRIGEGDYAQIGEEFLQHLTSLTRLCPQDEVIEIGCGIGRIAVPLTRVITPPGRYEGFDVVAGSIAWCVEHISSRFPHFCFQFMDVANASYNPSGRIRGDIVRFPFPDSSFDLVVAVSLFTHLMPVTADRYLSEIRRVLRPGGRFFASFFLWTPACAKSAAARGLFPFDRGTHRVMRVEDPEGAVAFEEAHILHAYDRHRLQITARVPGTWWLPAVSPPYQDLIVATRTVQPPVYEERATNSVQMVAFSIASHEEK